MEINNTLKPENAKELGYEWIQDVIYDPEAPVVAMADIEEKAKSGIYELGQPGSSNTENNLIGLYKNCDQFEIKLMQ